ncbi:MAG TPA: hypothetical protein DCS43_15875, partial [Verrucomicrobia bacterium]|nr:hypothetical protein [Verrucomicrobiota bacterium]
TLTIGQGDFGGGNYQGSIQGTNGKITKTGTSTITLSGTNTYTGVSTISGGMLQFAKQISLYNNTPGSWTKGNIVVNSGGTLALNVGGTGEFTAGNVTTLLGNLTANISNNGLRSGAAVAFDTSNASPATFTLASAIANSSGTGSGAIGVKKLGANTLVLAGTNTYTGGTTVNAGTLQVASINALPGFNVASRVSVSSSATLAVQAGGVGEWSSGDIDSLLGATPAAFASGSTFGIVVSTNNSFSYANNIGATQEDKSFVKSGDGTLTLSGANTYTGTTTINGGTLVLGADSTLPAANAVILAGGTLQMGSYSNAVGTLTVTGTNTIAVGTGTLRFANSAGATWTGSLVLTGALGANSIQFGTTSGGLSQAQLARITINGNEVFINGSGYIAMVPGGTVFRFW